MLLAEDVGFEPTDPFRPPAFKAGAIGHSANPPKLLFPPYPKGQLLKLTITELTNIKPQASS